MRFNRAFLATAKKPAGIAVERAGGQMASCRTFIHGAPEMADYYIYIERLVKPGHDLAWKVDLPFGLAAIHTA